MVRRSVKNQRRFKSLRPVLELLEQRQLLTVSPIANWQFDEGTGNSTTDDSGNGHTGTLTNGPTWTTGHTGNALSFSGSGGSAQYVNTTGESAFDFTSGESITIAAWVNPTALVSGNQENIVSKGTWNNQRNFALTLSGGPNGKVNFLYYDAGGNFQYFTSGTLPVQPNVWNHVAVTYTFGTGSSIQLYYNGSPLSGSWTNGTGNVAPVNNNVNLAIGSPSNGDATQRFDGAIDEVQIFDVTLTATEVQEVMNGSGGGGTPPPTDYVALWHFNETSGTTAADVTGSHNGTLTNGPTWTTGHDGNAVSFVGSGGSAQYVNVTGETAFDMPTGSSLSFAGWVYPTDLVAGNNEIFFAKGTSGTQKNYQAFVGSSGNLNFSYNDSSANVWTFGSTATGLAPANTWTHLAFTYTFGTGSTAQWYVNGSPVTASWGAGTGNVAPVTNNINLAIGALSNGGVVQRFDGKLDEFQVFNRILSAAEVTSIFSGGGGPPPTGNTRGYWQFDDGTGSTAADSSGNSNSATRANNSALWSDGKLGGGIFFDATTATAYLNVSNETSFDFSGGNNITLASWVNPTSLVTGNTETILAKGNSGSSQNYRLFLEYVSSTTGKVSFSYTDSGGTTHTYRTSAVQVNTNTWKHVAFTYTFGTGSSAKMYINGALVTGTWVAGTGNGAVANNNTTLTIGAESNAGTNRRYDGWLDEVQIRDVISTQTDIQSLMNNTTRGALVFDTGPMTFLDPFVIDTSSNISRTTLQPQRVGANNPVVTNVANYDNVQPWVTVIRDPATGNFTLWHDAIPRDEFGNYVLFPDNIGWGDDPNVASLNFRYLTSTNGSTWTIPADSNSGLAVTGGATIIDSGVAGAERYKMAYIAVISGQPINQRVAFSSNGKDWTAYSGNPIYTPSNDYGDFEHTFQNPFNGKYEILFRTNRTTPYSWTNLEGQNKSAPIRVITMGTSTDYKNWSQQPLWTTFAPDNQDSGITQFYSMTNVQQVGDLFVGTVLVLRDDLTAPGVTDGMTGPYGTVNPIADNIANNPVNPNIPIGAGLGYTMLAWSRDGIHWTRDRASSYGIGGNLNPTTDPHVFFGPNGATSGDTGKWDHAFSWITDSVVVGDDLFLYYGGYQYGHKTGDTTHNITGIDRQIGLVKTKINRYVGENAGGTQGTLRTVALQMPAVADGKIEINANAAGGTLKMRILDAATNTVISGLDYSNFTTVTTDGVHTQALWGTTTQTATKLAALAGDKIKIEFQMTNAKLYSFEWINTGGSLMLSAGSSGSMGQAADTASKVGGSKSTKAAPVTTTTATSPVIAKTTSTAKSAASTSSSSSTLSSTLRAKLLSSAAKSDLSLKLGSDFDKVLTALAKDRR